MVQGFRRPLPGGRNPTGHLENQQRSHEAFGHVSSGNFPAGADFVHGREE